MSHCPTCGAKLNQRKGKKVHHVLYPGKPYEQVITGYAVKWWCRVCKKYTASSAELMALGRINRTVKRMNR